MNRAGLILLLLLASSCTPAAVDRQFRTRVQSVSVTGSAMRDDHGVTSGTAGVKFEYRDPRLDGPAR